MDTVECTLLHIGITVEEWDATMLQISATTVAANLAPLPFKIGVRVNIVAQ